MDFEQLREIAFRFMTGRKAHPEREKGGIYYHGLRVSKTVLILRKSILPEDDSKDNVLRCAALFHDIGKAIEPHAKYGAVLTREILKDVVEQEFLEEVCLFIAQHCSRGEEAKNMSDHAKILQDADMIDHYGTYTIWHEFFYSAYHERSIPETVFYDEKKWEIHCEKNRRLINFEPAKQAFDEKVSFVNGFYTRMRAEAEGELFF